MKNITIKFEVQNFYFRVSSFLEHVWLHLPVYTYVHIHMHIMGESVYMFLCVCVRPQVLDNVTLKVYMLKKTNLI